MQIFVRRKSTSYLPFTEIPYAADAHKNVYVDLSAKTNPELVNIAIIKKNIEEEFTGFKLRMVFQLMLECALLSEDEYAK